MLRAERVFQIPQTVRQDHRRGARGNRQAVVAVYQEKEGAVLVAQGQVLVLQRPTILIPQNRQEHLVGQLGLDRGPVHVEEGRILGTRTVFEHVRPPGVFAGGDPHVVGDDIEELAHAVALEFAHKGVIVFFAAQLRVEGGVIDDVIAVRAPGRGLQVRRRVTVADAQVMQVRH